MAFSIYQFRYFLSRFLLLYLIQKDCFLWTSIESLALICYPRFIFFQTFIPVTQPPLHFFGVWSLRKVGCLLQVAQLWFGFNRLVVVLWKFDRVYGKGAAIMRTGIGIPGHKLKVFLFELIFWFEFDNFSTNRLLNGILLLFLILIGKIFVRGEVFVG